MQKTLLLVLIGLIFNISAFAEGTTLVACGWNENEDSLTLHQDTNGEIVALFSMIDHGTLVFEVKEVSPGVYASHELTFKVDGGELSIPSFNIHNEKFDCKEFN
jgi:hypothetical protein